MYDRNAVRLSDLISVKHGFAFPGHGFNEDPSLPTLVTPGNFAIGGGFRKSRLKTFAGEVPQQYVLAPADLIVTMTDLSREGATLGLPALVPADRVYLHNQRVGLVEVEDPSRIDRNFLHYYLRTEGYRAHILGTATGSTVRHTSPTKICSFVADLPPVYEQRAVAKVLGALDDKIATNTKLATTANTLAGLIFDLAVNDRPQRTISSILNPILGGTPHRSRVDYWDGDVLWASARDVTGAPYGVVVDTQDRITELAIAQTRAKPLPTGSVILTARGTVGAVARLGTPSSLNQSCYGFRPGRLPAGALYFSVLRATECAKAFAHGSVFDTITMRTFDYLKIADMALDEWHAIEAQIEPLLASITQVVKENRHLATTRDALLPQLMSGTLRVKDAERIAEEAL